MIPLNEGGVPTGCGEGLYVFAHLPKKLDGVKRGTAFGIIRRVATIEVDFLSGAYYDVYTVEILSCKKTPTLVGSSYHFIGAELSLPDTFELAEALDELKEAL